MKAMQDWANALKTFDVPPKDGDKIDQKMIKDIFDHLNRFYNKNVAQIQHLLQLPQTPKQAHTVFEIMRGTIRSPDQLIALLDALRQIPVSPDPNNPFSKYGPVRTIVDSDALQKSGWITYLKMSGEDKKKLWQKVQADIDFLRDYVDSEKSIFDAEKTCAYAQSVRTLINSTIDRYQKEYPFLIKKNNVPFSVQGVQSSLVGLFQRITLKWGAFFTNVKNMVVSNFGAKR
ncbi:MAG: hypothetical protein KGO83_01855 [Paenibacillaceae bacterium]|nr:hypothetical protein [Paenibacillaceae bacterium]